MSTPSTPSTLPLPLEPYHPALAVENEHLEHQERQKDTVEIAQIYMTRPQKYGHYFLGVWFNLAHGLNDEGLVNCRNNHEAKLFIVNSGYNFLSLKPLVAFNNA